MNPNSNAPFSQNSNNMNFENSQNQPRLFFRPNFSYPYFPQNTPNNLPYPFYHPQMQNFLFLNFPQNPNPPSLDVASENDLTNTTGTDTLSDSQISSFSTQPIVENVTSSQKTNKGKNKIVRHSWSMEDERMLVSAWLNISLDSIVDTNQNDVVFWKRIGKYFNENKWDGPKRDFSVLKSHWYYMVPKVNEFNQEYNRILDEHRSGWSDDQVKECAPESYYSKNQGKHFTLEHVWLMLKDEQKWTTNYPIGRSSKRSKNCESAYTISSDDETHPNVIPPVMLKSSLNNIVFFVMQLETNIICNSV